MSIRFKFLKMQNGWIIALIPLVMAGFIAWPSVPKWIRWWRSDSNGNVDFKKDYRESSNLPLNIIPDKKMNNELNSTFDKDFYSTDNERKDSFEDLVGDVSSKIYLKEYTYWGPLDRMEYFLNERNKEKDKGYYQMAALPEEYIYQLHISGDEAHLELINNATLVVSGLRSICDQQDITNTNNLEDDHKEEEEDVKDVDRVNFIKKRHKCTFVSMREEIELPEDALGNLSKGKLYLQILTIKIPRINVEKLKMGNSTNLDHQSSFDQ